MLKRILLSKQGAISLLCLSTLLDCGTTYATIGNKLYLDGNPFVRGLNWNQAILLQIFVTLISILAFLLAWRKQNKKIWPNISMKYFPFVIYYFKKGLNVKFNLNSIKDDFIYTGLVLIWILTCVHLIAGILAIIPLLGGPSILSLMYRIGFNGLRQSQFVILVFVVIFSFIIGHYPLYLGYVQVIKKAR